MTKVFRAAVLVGLTVLAAVSARAVNADKALTDEDLLKLARRLVESCPAGASAPIVGRDACASSLAKIQMLDDAAINNTVRWGGHTHNDYVPSHNSLTMFDTFVWKKLYLSLFEFTGEYKLEVLPDESRLLRLSARCRRLPDSEYPYPFWHSEKKWHAYQQTNEIGLLFKGGKLLAGYRDVDLDKSLPTSDHAWSGYWTSDEQGKVSPRAALYSYLLSPDNPELDSLDRAYKALALEARKYQCAQCHSPSNPANMNPLLIFNLPSQALSGRHQIVFQIESNNMPPGRGISDESSRRRILKLARTFERTGDQALAYEQHRPEGGVN
jgi:hypothetical protein